MYGPRDQDFKISRAYWSMEAITLIILKQWLL